MFLRSRVLAEKVNTVDWKFEHFCRMAEKKYDSYATVFPALGRAHSQSWPMRSLTVFQKIIQIQSKSSTSFALVRPLHQISWHSAESFFHNLAGTTEKLSRLMEEPRIDKTLWNVRVIVHQPHWTSCKPQSYGPSKHHFHSEKHI